MVEAVTFCVSDGNYLSFIMPYIYTYIHICKLHYHAFSFHIIIDIN